MERDGLLSFPPNGVRSANLRYTRRTRVPVIALSVCTGILVGRYRVRPSGSLCQGSSIASGRPGQGDGSRINAAFATSNTRAETKILEQRAICSFLRVLICPGHASFADRVWKAAEASSKGRSQRHQLLSSYDRTTRLAAPQLQRVGRALSLTHLHASATSTPKRQSGPDRSYSNGLTRLPPENRQEGDEVARRRRRWSLPLCLLVALFGRTTPHLRALPPPVQAATRGVRGVIAATATRA